MSRVLERGDAFFFYAVLDAALARMEADEMADQGATV